MTCANLDELMTYLDQVAVDRMREYATDVLVNDDDFAADAADVIDAATEQQEQELIAWRVRARREFEALPLTFPVEVIWRNASEFDLHCKG